MHITSEKAIRITAIVFISDIHPYFIDDALKQGCMISLEIKLKSVVSTNFFENSSEMLSILLRFPLNLAEIIIALPISEYSFSYLSFGIKYLKYPLKAEE